MESVTGHIIKWKSKVQRVSTLWNVLGKKEGSIRDYSLSVHFYKKEYQK